MNFNDETPIYIQIAVAIEDGILNEIYEEESQIQSTTEISIISLGGIVLSKLLPFGGDTFNDAIVAAVKKNYNLLIGNKTASKLKKTLGNITKVVYKIFN